MGMSRRFLNLIVDYKTPGIRSLCCIDLRLQKFFHAPQPATTIEGGSESSVADAANAFNPKNKQAGVASISMEEFKLPNPKFSFKAHAALSPEMDIDCFALADRRVLCTDQSGRTFLYDADTSDVVTMPSLHKPKSMPISLFVPSTDDAEANHGRGGSIYIMEMIPKPESGGSASPSGQFEALVYDKSTVTSSESWRCQQIPPPPFVRDPAYRDTHNGIMAYAVVGGEFRHPCICISVQDAGTYCLDTASHTWTHIGKWTLPFLGKAEYVPELKLWLGFAAQSGHFAAADLSNIFALDSQPQLVTECKELEPPDDWEEWQDSQLVNLGSGRFCVARFFEIISGGDPFDDDYIDQNVVVLTGVKVLPNVPDGNCSGSGSENGKVNLEVTPLKSRYLVSSNTIIDAVF